MAASAVASALEAGFLPYAERVMPYVVLGLKNHQEYEVCGVAVGSIGDISRAIEKEFLRYSDDVVRVLLENLQSPDLDNVVKPPILGVFGDIAMAIRGEFTRYLQPVMMTLGQAAFVPANPDDSDMVDYVNQVRESVCEAFTGIVQGLSDENKQEALLPCLEIIFGFINFVAADKDREPELLRLCCALVGDVTSNLQGHCTAYVRQPSILGMLREGYGKEMEEATYANEVIAKFAK